MLKTKKELLYINAPQIRSKKWKVSHFLFHIIFSKQHNGVMRTETERNHIKGDDCDTV